MEFILRPVLRPRNVIWYYKTWYKTWYKTIQTRSKKKRKIRISRSIERMDPEKHDDARAFATDDRPCPRERQSLLNEVAQISRSVHVAWVPNNLVDRCYECQATFSLMFRKHHCRVCGNIFCDPCSVHRIPLISQGFFTPVRTCNSCFIRASSTSTGSNNTGSSTTTTTTIDNVQYDYSNSMEKDPFFRDDDRRNTSEPMIPPTASGQEKSQSLLDCCLFTGEVSLLQAQDVVYENQIRQGCCLTFRTRSDDCLRISGTLWVTNFRLVFVPGSTGTTRTSNHVSLPLRMIDRSKRAELCEEDTGVLTLVSKDFRHVKFIFRGLVAHQVFATFDRVISLIREQAWIHPRRGGDTREDHPRVALRSADIATEESSESMIVYHVQHEFRRMMMRQERMDKVEHRSGWKCSYVNQDYDLCSTYPQVLMCPDTISDDVLTRASVFRSQGRVPVLSWRDPVSGATLCRSSQPLVGLGQNKSTDDIQLIQAIAETQEASTDERRRRRHFVIVDARPWRNALAQKAMGQAGYEMTDDYAQHASIFEEREQHHDDLRLTTTYQLKFMNLENIHVIRKSFQKLHHLCIHLHPPPTNVKQQPPTGHHHHHHHHPMAQQQSSWLDQLAGTKWLEHVSAMVESAIEMVQILRHERTSILVHCSDGWDRTPTLTSLVQIILDPYFRTLRGFQLLIEKEFLSFGHKFFDRTNTSRASAGTTTTTAASNQGSPVFLLWIDCVYQLTCQCPLAFEFNERFLILLLDELYSGRFGTLMYNSEKERREHERRFPTPSLWTFLNSECPPELITNPFYRRTRSSMFRTTQDRDTGLFYPEETQESTLDREEEDAELHVDGSVESLNFWTGYYLRWHQAGVQSLQSKLGIETEFRTLLKENHQLQKELDAYKLKLRQASSLASSES